jgi:hypothetical protein
MIKFFAQMVQLGRITIEEIEEKRGKEFADLVRAELLV